MDYEQAMKEVAQQELKDGRWYDATLWWYDATL